MKYDVILETTAVLDLYSIMDYITHVLKAPDAARRVALSIEDEIMALDSMPLRHRIVADEPYATYGVRLMPVENYTVFYIVDEVKWQVHVLRVLYSRRNWRAILFAD